jgi:hypothetical protein
MASAVVHDLEQTQAVLEQIAFPSTENPPGVTEVVVLPGHEYDELIASGVAPNRTQAYFGLMGPAYARQPRFVLRDDGPAGRAAHLGGIAPQGLMHIFTFSVFVLAPSLAL